jgi:2-oxoglutarate dehydrogenase E2 component (dihydrolipoamide succinyltransferase)
MPVELKVPSAGESITEVFIGTWLKSEGDAVAEDEPLVEIETDKATLEVPAPVSGRLAKVLKKQGEEAAVGETIAQIAEGESAAEKEEEKEPAQKTEQKAGAKEDTGEKPQAEVEEKEEKSEKEEARAEPRVMPAAQRALDEHGLAADEVKATGPGGRLLKEDVLRHVKEQESAKSPPAPEPPRSETPAQTPEQPPAPPAGERQEEVVPMSPLRRRVAERLVASQQNAALLTTFNEIDMSQVMALRAAYKELFEKRYNIRLGFMSFFVKATIDALQQIPQLNAEVRGTDIIYRNYYDIGVAVSSKKGLIVPVIKNAERKSFAEIEATIKDFGSRAQSNKLMPEELQGGTFTVSNGGVFGSLMSTPIINPPQSGVLGMHAIQERPLASGGQVVIRPMMYVALTYDHRIVDGREAVTFLKRIKEAVESPARMLLEV